MTFSKNAFKRFKTASLLAATVMAVSLLGCQNDTPAPSNTTESVGMRVYNENCASCHGLSGAGASMLLEGRNIHFNEPTWQKKYTNTQLLTIIQNGRGSMPSFKEMFAPEEEKQLVEYVRALGKS